MLSPEECKAVCQQTRVLQIITLALAASLIGYLTFVVLQPALEQPEQQSLLPLWGVGFAVLQIILAIALPQFIGSQQRKSIVEHRPIVAGQTPTGDAADLLGGLQVRRIVAAALLEGAGFFNIFAYSQYRHPYSLAAAIAMIVGILTLFPLRPLVEHWLDREIRTVRELRGLQR